MKKYEYVKDLTSDVAFRAFGNSYKDLYENAGLALSSIICKTELLKPKRTVKISAKADNYEDLLFNFLQQIIAAVDTEEIFFCEFKVIKITSKSVSAVCKGEGISPAKGNTVVKAITKHKFALTEDNTMEALSRFSVFVTVDI